MASAAYYSNEATNVSFVRGLPPRREARDVVDDLSGNDGSFGTFGRFFEFLF